MALGSSRPYLIRALYAWIVDGDEDPFVVVDEHYPGVEVPAGHGKDGQVVLNLAPRAINGLSMDAAGVVFETRFGGLPTRIILPYGAITAIYGRDSGLGMAFGQEPGGPPERETEDSVARQPLPTEVTEAPRKRPNLRVVKSDD